MARRCVALLHEGWADWESGPVLALLREFFGWSVLVATPDGGVATSIGGVRALGDLAFAEVDPTQHDLVLVIGSERWFKEEDPRVSAIMRSAVAAHVPLGAICGAVVQAARAGLLDDRAHTGNGREELAEKAPNYRGTALYREVAHAVADRGVVTASGEAPRTFAAEIARLLHPESAPLLTQYLDLARAELG